MKINGSTFIITGAAQGLGAAMAVELARAGAHLALLDINDKALKRVYDECVRIGSNCKKFVVDVADEARVIACFADIEQQMPAMSGLINNAGIISDGMLVKVKNGEITDRLSLQQWQRVIDINLTGVFLCGREAASTMIRQQRSGVIINISSISRAGNVGQTNYAATKAGVVAMSATWAKELSRYNIRSVAIAPGVFATEMIASMKKEAHERLTGAIPAKRVGLPTELAKSVLFVIENDYINGRTIEVDGGLRL